MRAALLVLPRVRPDGRRILRDRIPAPFQLPGDRVEGAHLAARFCRRRVVLDGRADDDRVADDGGWRRDLVVGKAARSDAQPFPEIDGPLLAETRNRLSGPGVQRDETRVDGGDEDAALAAALPRGHAAAREIAVARVARHLRIERPSLLPGHRVQRDDAPDRRAQVQRAVDVERRRLERRRPAVLRLIRVAGAKRPGDLERRDVLAADGVEGREALAARVAPVGGPITNLRRTQKATEDEHGARETIRFCA